MSDRRTSADVGAAIEARLELLQGMSIFYTLSDHELRRLARRLAPRQVSAGTVLQRQGEPVERLFILSSGRCEVRSQWAPAHSVPIALLTAGDFFGLSAVLNGHTPDATVTATEATELFELHRDDIERVLVPGSAGRKELARLAEQRRATIAELVTRAQAVSPGQHAMVVAVYSVKGGSGKTSLAVNLAVALGMRHRGEVVLLDLGLPYNHAALVANLVPTGCLAMADKLGADGFEEALLSSCLHHPLGAMVLPSALKVEQSELVTPQLVQRAIDVLERTFSFVVVDLGVAIGETALSVLERAGRVLVVITPELPSLKDTAELLEVLEGVLKIPAGQMMLVLNHPRPRSMVGRADAERVIGRRMDVEVSNDGIRFDRAAVTGEVLVAGAPSSPPAKAIQRLAAEISDVYRARARAI